MARIKPTPHIVGNIPQAEAALTEIAALDRKLDCISNELNAEIDAAKDTAQQKSAGLLSRRKDLADALATYATLNKGDLFRDKKSLDLAFGIMGFRQSTQIAQVNRITQAMTLEKLHEYAFTDAIRTKEELNKDIVAGWPEERLALVGLKRRQLDTFYIEIKAENVNDAA